MKASLALLVAPLFFAACSDRGLEPGDTAPFDLAHAHDFALPDLSTGDLPTGDSCTAIPTWASDNGVMSFNEDPSSTDGYLWDDYAEGFRSGDYPDGGGDVLFYEFYRSMTMSEPVTVPHALDFTNPNEALGLVLDYPLDGSGAGTYFLATTGDVTVTAIDDTQPSGNVAVHGTNVVLQEIDDSGEIVPNGACVQIGSFDLSAMYGNGL